MGEVSLAYGVALSLAGHLDIVPPILRSVFRLSFTHHGFGSAAWRQQRQKVILTQVLHALSAGGSLRRHGVVSLWSSRKKGNGATL